MREKSLWFFHILSLNCLAIAYPLFQIIDNGPEFFVNRRASAADVWILTAILLFAIPVLLLFLRVVLSLLSRRFAEIFGCISIWLLALLYFMTVGTTSLRASGYIVLPFAFLLSCVLLLLYVRSSIAKTFLSFLGLMLIAAPLSFFLSPGVRSLLFAHSEQAWTLADSKSRTPVVVVLFDEFPLSVLLDRNEKIDAKRFPNFAALAEQSYWFKNATAVNQFTPIAVPAVLSGLLPKTVHVLPTLDDYPRNIFTMLGASHAMKVQEPFTHLCPNDLCRQVEKASFTQRLELMLLDLGAVYLNLAVPQDFGFELPDVTGKWGDFWSDLRLPWQPPNFSRDARIDGFLRYINSLKKPQKPTLYFSHHILPHMPYQFMPSGKMYFAGRIYGYQNNRWVEDPLAIRRAYHQFLLQVAGTDRLLGRFFARLKEIGVYDEALVIVTADHGMSFQPHTYRRGEPGHPQFYEDMLSVPMFVKLPGQTKGVEEWRNVETLDVLPTIADVLNIPLNWQLDGQSMFSKSPGRGKKQAFAGRNPETANDGQGIENAGEGEGQLLTYDVPDALPRFTLDWKLGLPGYEKASSADPYYIGDSSEFVGKRVDEFKVSQAPGLSFSLQMKRGISKDGKSVVYDAKAGECPCGIRAKVEGNVQRSDEFAVSVNGVLWGFDTVTSPIGAKESNIFVFLVSEAAFSPGLNRIEMYEVLKDASGGLLLQALSQEARE